MVRVTTRVMAAVVGAFLWMLGVNAALALLSWQSDGAVIAGFFALVLLGSVAVFAVARGGMRLVSMLPLMMLAVLATGCGTTIQPGHAGIVVDYYGKNRGVQDYTVTTGRVWVNPWTTEVLEWPTFVQSVVWTHDVNEGHPSNEEITFTNRDQMQIAADISLAYHLDVSKLPAFYVKFRTADMATFTHGYLRSLTRDKFNEIAGRYTIAQIMGDNGPFLKEVREALQKDLDPFGVVLESQFGIIGAPRPPLSVVEAINQQAVAQRLALTKENELRQVQADVAKTVAKAEGDARATAVWAEAQSAANQKLANSLTANLIELKRLEKWNGALPQVSSGATPFISLSK
jgi:regulator of protease activity HflC (stomatin/prohibitin superfamily)